MVHIRYKSNLGRCHCCCCFGHPTALCLNMNDTTKDGSQSLVEKVKSRSAQRRARRWRARKLRQGVKLVFGQEGIPTNSLEGEQPHCRNMVPFMHDVATLDMG